MTNQLLTRPSEGFPGAEEAVRIQADHESFRRIGTWTEAGRFEVRARDASIVLDLRAPRLPKEIDIDLRLDRARLKLLLPEGAVIEHWDLEWDGRGQIKDAYRPRAEEKEAATPTEQIRIRLRGKARRSEVRVYRGGMAQLAAICSREFIADAKRAHQAATFPTVDDPTRTAVPTR